MPNARMEAVSVLGQRVVKLTLASDWKWSSDIAPVVGTTNCEAAHGDAYAISPDHDAWVVGGKQAVVYEFSGVWGD